MTNEALLPAQLRLINLLSHAAQDIYCVTIFAPRKTLHIPEYHIHGK